MSFGFALKFEQGYGSTCGYTSAVAFLVEQSHTASQSSAIKVLAFSLADFWYPSRSQTRS